MRHEKHEGHHEVVTHRCDDVFFRYGAAQVQAAPFTNLGADVRDWSATVPVAFSRFALTASEDACAPVACNPGILVLNQKRV
jgi:hypothetical protein